LTVHLGKGGGGDLGIIGCVGIGARHLGRGVFEIGQINVHQAAQHAQCLHAFVTAAVPDHGDLQCGTYRRERARHAVGVVRGSDEIDVVRACIGQAQE